MYQLNLTERLERGEKIDWGFDVSYPLENVGRGAGAVAFRAADGKILRVGDKRDHSVNMLSGMYDWMPTIHQAVLVRSDEEYGASVILRDDITSLYDVYPALENKGDHLRKEFLMSAYPNMPGIQDLDTILGCSISYAFSSLFFYDFETEILKQYINSVIETVDSLPLTMTKKRKAEYRQKMTGIYKETFYTVPVDDRSFCLPQKTRISVLENGSIRHRSTKVGVLYILEKFISISESILYNRDQWKIIKKTLQFAHQFIDDIGFVPYDCHYNNLGIQDGKIIFRDPYHMANETYDYQLRINHHRINKGLPPIPGMASEIKRVDVLPALIMMGDEPTISRLGLDPSLFYAFENHTGHKSGYRIIETRSYAKAVLYLSDARNAEIRDRLSDILMTDEYHIAECNQDDVNRFKSIMEWYTDIESPAFCVQNVKSEIPIQPGIFRHILRRYNTLNDVIDGYLPKGIVPYLGIVAKTEDENQACKNACLEIMRDYSAQTGAKFYDSVVDNWFPKTLVEASSQNKAIEQVITMLFDIYQLTGRLPLLDRNTFCMDEGRVKLSVCVFRDEDIDMVLERLNQPMPAPK